MAQPPIQYFRKEDFPELKQQTWAEKLFNKLNAFTRQSQLVMSNNVSVANNLSGFWWEGVVGNYRTSPGIVFPFTVTSPTLPTTKAATAINAFPYSFTNKLAPKEVKAVIVGQAFDLTDQSKHSLPALLGGVAWVRETQAGQDRVKVHAINGMLTGRSYFVRLLVLCD